MQLELTREDVVLIVAHLGSALSKSAEHTTDYATWSLHQRLLTLLQDRARKESPAAAATMPLPFPEK